MFHMLLIQEQSWKLLEILLKLKSMKWIGNTYSIASLKRKKHLFPFP